MNMLRSVVVWGLVVLVGVASFTTLALSRGEQISAIWMVSAAISVYCIAFRYYSLYIAKKVLQLDPNRLTPAERYNDGLDYVPTSKGVLFGQHFAAIAGAGPLVGPVLAAHRGRTPIRLDLLLHGKTGGVAGLLDLGKAGAVRVSPQLLDALREDPAVRKVKLTYSPPWANN